MKKLNVFVALLAFLGWMSGCSVYMAAKQPDQKISIFWTKELQEAMSLQNWVNLFTRKMKMAKHAMFIVLFKGTVQGQKLDGRFSMALQMS